ncbi:MAG TPA: hypothetical protein VN772_06905 [Solirubrobacteraceae bacterium]|nr:hypothetical protein [Solirubrobacteraceae bacterium]
MNARAGEPTSEIGAIAAWPRRHARSERRAAWADIALGLLAAALALIFAPGLGVVAVGALLLLAACAVSAAFRRARSRAGRRAGRRQRAAAGVGAVSRWR